jgi:rubrerythrin
MSKDGWLPPGVTDADIDRAAPGYYDEELEEPRLWHCSACGTPNDRAEDWYCSVCHKLFDEDEDDWEG